MCSFINKEYNKPPFALPGVQQKFGMALQAVLQTMGANQPDSGAFAADDMVIWFRNLGFLEQEDFIAAFGPYLADPTLRARIWRIYMLCWGVKSCVGLPGDFMDVGCYDGRTVAIMARYSLEERRWGKAWGSPG